VEEWLRTREVLPPWPESSNVARAPKTSGSPARTSGWSATALQAAGPAASASSPSAPTCEAEDFALKVEHDKRAHVFVDPKAGQALFRAEAETWLDHHLGADSSISTYRSVLRAHINPAIGGKPIGATRREDIKALIALMRRKGLCASRIACAYLVISAVLAEAIRDKKLAESPCTGIQLPSVVTAADFTLPTHEQIDAVAAGLPPDWATTLWLMHGCGLRIGEALAVNLRCRVDGGKTLRVREQVTPAAQLKPLKFRRAGEFRDIPLPEYVSEAIDKHVADHGTTSDGYRFQGRKYKLVIRRSYQQHFQQAAQRAGLPPEFIPALTAAFLRFNQFGRGYPDHRGLPLARPQEH
jgi:integrase